MHKYAAHPPPCSSASSGTSNLISNVKLDWYLPKGYPAKPELMNKLVTRLMNYMMPWLLNKLQDDYARWAAGRTTGWHK